MDNVPSVNCFWQREMASGARGICFIVCVREASILLAIVSLSCLHSFSKMATAAAAATSSIAAVSSTCCAKQRAGPSSPSLPVLLKRRGVLRVSGSSLSAGRRKASLVCVRATASSDESVADASKQLQELFDDLKARYDALENKSQVWIYGGGALFALWFSSIIVGAVNSIPLLPKILELVGLGYSGWFVYRYLLFKSSRKQLAEDIEVLKRKVAGVPRSDFTTEDDE